MDTKKKKTQHIVLGFCTIPELWHLKHLQENAQQKSKNTSRTAVSMVLSLCNIQWWEAANTAKIDKGLFLFFASLLHDVAHAQQYKSLCKMLVSVAKMSSC